LGVGGALPRTGSARSDRNAYIVTGLPASGKSTLVNKIADDLGAVIVDSDFAKRKFPEFDSSAGAQLVHEESALIVEGGDADEHGEVEPSLLGHNQRSIEKLRDALKSSGYHVHLTTVVLSRSQATVRALHRFLETSRYVPLGLVFDNYANDPALTYYKSRVSHLNNPSDWESFGALCSQTGKYKVLDCSNDTNPAAMFREAK
jgi:predicted ABC-type ATPase